MRFWKRKKKEAVSSVTGGKRSSSGKRFPVEVKLLAARAREAGMSPAEVAQLVGASPYTVSKWFQLYRDQGAEALIRQATYPGTRKLCEALERKGPQHWDIHTDRNLVMDVGMDVDIDMDVDH